MSIKPNGDGYTVDYFDLTPGSAVGDTTVLTCSRCGRPGIRWRGTKQVAHLVSYRKEPCSGKERVEPVLRCKDAWKPPGSAEEPGVPVVPEGNALTRA